MSDIFKTFSPDVAMIVVLLSAFGYLLRVVWRYVTQLHRDTLAQNKEYALKYEALIHVVDEHLAANTKAIDELREVVRSLQAYYHTYSSGGKPN